MQKHRRLSGGPDRSSLIAVILGLVILGLLLLTPIKGWLNRIPYLWRVVYPLMALFAGYLLVGEIRAQGQSPGADRIVEIVTWAVLLLGAFAATVYAYGGPRFFFIMGRWCAILFIVVEVAHTLLAGLSRAEGAATAGGDDR